MYVYQIERDVEPKSEIAEKELRDVVNKIPRNAEC